jgi:hypothetical protein
MVNAHVHPVHENDETAENSHSFAKPPGAFISPDARTGTVWGLKVLRVRIKISEILKNRPRRDGAGIP